MKKYRGLIKINIKKVSKNFGVKFVTILALFLIPGSVFASAQSDLDAINQQIQQLNQQISQKKTEGNSIANQVAILNSQIYQMQLQINASQAEIDITNGEIADTTAKIQKAETDLATAKNQLSEIVTVMYEDGQVSNIELIAKSKSFSEFVNRSEYIESVQLKVKEVADQIVALKNELEQKKSSLNQKKEKLVSLKNQQLGAQNDIAVQRSVQQQLLASNQGGQAYLQKSLKDRQAEAAQLRAAIAAAGRSGGGGTYGAGSVPQYFQTDYNDIINGSGDTIHDYGCGVTSIAMLLTSYGYSISPVGVASNSAYFPAYGIDAIQWYNIPRATGYRFNIEGSPYSTDMSKADSWASTGRPFIVWIRNAFGAGLNHFVVIVGGTPGNWMMNDPVRGGGLRFDTYYSRGQVIQTEFITP